MMMNIKNAIFIGLFIYATPVLADSASVIPAAQIGQMVIGLAIVLLLIYALSWFARRFMLNAVQTKKTLNLVNVLSLGTKEKLAVVEFEGKTLLLGVTSHSIARLAQVPTVQTQKIVAQHNHLVSPSNGLDPMLLSENRPLGAKTTSEFSEKLKAFLNVDKSFNSKSK